MKQAHPIQMSIFNKLLFSDGLTYTEMKPDKEIPNNQFQFHLDKLISLGFIKKEDTKYFFTDKGKDFAGMIDTDRAKVQKQPKLSVRLFCFNEIDGEKNILFYKRLKQPFFGKQGLPAGKIKFGETFIEAANRELLEETSLKGEIQIFNIEHWHTIHEETKELLEDKIFINCIVENPTGKLTGNEEGEFKWIPILKIRELITNPFKTIEDEEKIIQLALKWNGNIQIDEVQHYTKDF